MHEAALWTELGLRYSPVEDLRLSLDQMFRVNENISNPSALMSELSLRYSPLRWLRFGVGYRLAYKVDKEGQLRLRHRIHIDLSSRHRLRWVRFGFRLRFQEEARVDDDDGAPWRHILRFKAGVEIRRIPVIDPFVSFEVFFRLADGEQAVSGYTLRGTLGFGIDIADGTLELGYRIEAEIEESTILHVILLGWHFDIES